MMDDLAARLDTKIQVRPGDKASLNGTVDSHSYNELIKMCEQGEVMHGNDCLVRITNVDRTGEAPLKIGHTQWFKVVVQVEGVEDQASAKAIPTI